MKIYRGSFWSGRWVQSIFIPWTVANVLCVLIVMNNVDFMKLFSWYGLIILLPNLLFYCIVFLSEFYIIFSNDALILKNAICPFLYEKHFYKNVEKVNIKRPGGMAPPYIQVITKKNRKHAWKYIIDLVAPKEYDKLVEAIKLKGVIVDNENLVNWN